MSPSPYVNYWLYAWNDAELWGSQYASLFSVGFFTPPIDPFDVFLGNFWLPPRPLVPQATRPAANGFAYSSPCTTMFTWTDGLDYDRRTGGWPIDYVLTVVKPSGAATTYPPVTTPSRPLQLESLSGTWHWGVVARLRVGLIWPGGVPIYFTTTSPTFSFWMPATRPTDCSSTFDDAGFATQTPPPSQMSPGATGSVSVTMKNIGTTSWRGSEMVRLGSQNPQGNVNWGFPWVALGPSDVVAPGQQHTFAFNVTAPSTAGTYNFQWQMVRDTGPYWFGAFSPNVVVQVAGLNTPTPTPTRTLTVPPPTATRTPTPQPVDDAAFVSQAPPPACMWPGTAAGVSVTMRNTGTTVWDFQYRLGSQNPQDNQTWGLGRVGLATGETVQPGQQKTFTFNATAPSTAGTYNFQWRMVHEQVRWFGPSTPNVAVINKVPQPPTGLAPTGGMVLPSTTTSVTLLWPAAPFATRYAVRLRDDTDHRTGGPDNCPQPHENTYLCVDGVTSTSYSSPVVPGHSYTWWLHAGDCIGYSVRTSTTFRVAAAVPPPPPTGLNPAGATLPSGTTTVLLSWAATPGATEYAVRLQDLTDPNLRSTWSCPGSQTIYLCVNDITPHSYTATVVPGHSYMWWVHAGNEAGYSTRTTATFSVAP